MHLSRNGKLGLLAVVVVALAAGGAAYAATQLHTTKHVTGTFRPSASGYGGGFGRGGGFRGRDGDGGGPGGFGFRGAGGSFQAAASYLGLSTAQIFQDLQSGKTLAQIADATSGKSASGLIDAMVKAERQQVDQAVSSGTLTQSQADRLTANLKSRVTAMVNGTGFGGGGRGFGGPPGGGNGFGGQGGGGGNPAPSQGSSPSQPDHI